MERRREFVGVKFFLFTEKAAECKIPDCDYSYEPMSGSELHSKPLVDHLRRKHPKEYKEAEEEADEQKSLKRKYENISNYSPSDDESSSKRPKREVIEIEMSKEMVHKFAVEAVTVNGLPLSVFEKSGISNLISPILCKLGISLNQRVTRSLILQAAEKKIVDLKTEFLDRLICVKYNLSTRRGRHFLGVDFQAVINGKLRVATAAVKEMTEGATGAEIRSILVACLQKLGIQEHQIYTLTTDNGSNVTKAGRLMLEDAQAVENEVDESDEDDPQAVENEVGESDEDDPQAVENEVGESDEDDPQAVENEVGESDEDDPIPEAEGDSVPAVLDEEVNSIKTAADNVSSVRCAVHTLQLSVKDVINANDEIKKLLVKVRKVVNKTRTHNIRLVFRQAGAALPKVDCKNRWETTYDMLECVVKSKPFLLQIGLAKELFRLSEKDWAYIDNLLCSLKPLHSTTIALQLSKLTAGEFLCEWLKCKIKLRQLAIVDSERSTSVSAAFLQAMEEREVNILSNPAFLSAIYMDPRYQCLLKEPQKVVAKAHLTALWRRLSIMNMNSDISCESEKNEEDPPSDDSLIEQLLCESDSTTRASTATNVHEASVMIKSFDSTPRVERKEDIFHWWHCHPHTELKRLAEAVIGLPVSAVTQASADRTFSGLRYILQERRLGHKADIIDALMMLRCNA
ncbi:uncharacterized protein LOC121862043 [Homarus americanus]|uniref:uncharacterized protein LOC121862043 n=1 Tax=Homarus americanus TaxID=6706 RepID=UPI001C463993|nr:uncharacterized protein LOC121862043 [Homarus americanus]